MKAFPLPLASIILVLTFEALYADVVPFSEPWHEGLNVKEFARLTDMRLGLWLQYRVMYKPERHSGPARHQLLERDRLRLLPSEDSSRDRRTDE